MASSPTTRIPISFDRAYRLLSTLLFLPPSSAYVAIDGDEAEVRMGWAFRARFPRTALVSADEIDIRPLSRGVHGFAGRWLVNGSGRGILRIDLEPPPRAYVMGFPIRLRQLLVSVADPGALANALRARDQEASPTRA
jgi:hypothetical protein